MMSNADETTATGGAAGRRRSSISNSTPTLVKKIRPQLIRPRLQIKQQQQQQPQPKLESHFLKSSLASPSINNGNNNFHNNHDSGSGEDLFADSETTTSELFGQCTKTKSNQRRTEPSSPSPSPATNNSSKQQFMTSMMRSHGSSSRLASMEEENTDDGNSSSEYSDDLNDNEADDNDEVSGDYTSTLHDSKNTATSSLDLTSEVAAMMMATEPPNPASPPFSRRRHCRYWREVDCREKCLVLEWQIPAFFAWKPGLVCWTLSCR